MVFMLIMMQVIIKISLKTMSSSPLTITKAFILRLAWLTVSGRGGTLAYIGNTYSTLHNC